MNAIEARKTLKQYIRWLNDNSYREKYPDGIVDAIYVAIKALSAPKKRSKRAHIERADKGIEYP